MKEQVLLNLEALDLSDVAAAWILTDASIDVLSRSYTKEAIVGYFRTVAERVENEPPGLRLVDDPIH
jgi:hypothetical protein